MNRSLTRTPGRTRPAWPTVQRLPQLLLLALFVWSVWQTGLFSGTVVNTGGWTLALRFVRAAFTPDLSPAMVLLAAQSALVTLAYAVAGTALALVLGVIGGVLCAERWWQVALPRAGRWPWLLARSVLAVPRALHEVVWGLLLINIIGLDPLSAVLALGIPFGAVTAKVFAEILDETPTQALTALTASGVRPLAALLYTLIPQALPDLLGYTFYRLECAIRSAAVLGLIGAGGLGYQILLSTQSLRYDEVWTFVYALVALSGLTDLWSAALRGRLQLSARDDRCRPSVTRALPPEADWLVRGSLLGAALAIPLAFWYLQPDVARLWAPRAAQLTHELVRAALPPRLDRTTLSDLWRVSGQTLAMSVLAMVAAGVGAALVAFCAARRPRVDGRPAGYAARLVALVCRAALLLLRAIAEPIWALLALLVLFPGILPGAVGLAAYNLGILGRLDAEVIENLDQRPVRALRALGATAAQTFLYAELPVALPRLLAFALYRWEVAIRATVVVGLVGAGGLGRLLGEQIAAFDYHGMTATLLAFGVLTLLVDVASAAVRWTLR